MLNEFLSHADLFVVQSVEDIYRYMIQLADRCEPHRICHTPNHKPTWRPRMTFMMIMTAFRAMSSSTTG